jgi:hypothetical protein
MAAPKSAMMLGRSASQFRTRWRLVAVLASGFLPRLDAQTIQPRLGPLESACTFDTAGVRDKVLYTLFVAPRDPVDSAELVPVLRLIAASFVAPDRVSVPLWPGTYYSEADSGSPVPPPEVTGVGPFTGEFWIDFKKGKVKHALWHLPPGSPQLQAALLEAVQRADSEQGVFGLMPQPRRGGRLRLALRTAIKPELVTGVPILRLRVALIRVERPVAVIHIPMPVYPTDDRKHATRATVDLQYVVTEDGRASSTSMRILQADDSAFAASAREAIEEGEFEPARIRGCAVQMLVQQRVSYGF